MTRTRRQPLLVMAATCLLTCMTPVRGQSPAPTGEPAIEAAIQQLTQGDWLLKWQSMRLLADAKATAALEPLRRIVHNQREDPWVRGRALVAVAEIHEGAALGPALTMARGDETSLRAAAIEALGIIGSPRGKDLVLQALDERSPAEVRHKAVEAYARIQGESALRFVEAGVASDDAEMVRHAVRGLSYIDTPQAREQLIQLVEGEDTIAATEAATAMRRLTLPEAIPVLLKRASAVDGPSAPREAARAALLSYSSSALADPLTTAFHEGEDPVRRVVVELLTSQPAPDAVEAVAQALRRGGIGEDVMVEALSLLGSADAQRYRDILEGALSHPSPRVRQAAVAQVALTDIDLFEVMRPLLTDPQVNVRGQVLQELASSDLPTPGEGIVAYLQPMLQLAQETEAGPLLALVGSRLRSSEAAAALRELSRFLLMEKHRKTAAEVLGRVGDSAMQRRVAALQGYITDWRVVGPFARSGDLKAAMDEVLPPEQAAAFDETYDDDGDTIGWRAMPHIDVTGRTDPREALGERTPRGIIFLGAVIHVDQAMQATIALGSGGPARVFLDGSEIIVHPDRGNTEQTTQLRTGEHRVLIKLAGNSWEWPFRLRVTDEQGVPLAGLSPGIR